MICECVLYLVKRLISGRRAGWKERRGGDLYFWRRYSHGVPGERGRCGLPPPWMAAAEKPAGEEQQKLSVTETSKNKNSLFFGAWQLKNSIRFSVSLN